MVKEEEVRKDIYYELRDREYRIFYKINFKMDIRLLELLQTLLAFFVFKKDRKKQIV